jgi:hypothetical protein
VREALADDDALHAPPRERRPLVVEPSLPARPSHTSAHTSKAAAATDRPCGEKHRGKRRPAYIAEAADD